MDSKTTSKTSCLKALLLRAWRERWSDLQWGINIKTVLPRGVSGDVYDLADCILQQAVVGSGANQLVLSYLKHSLSTQLVSHAAVLQRLAKFQDLHKVHCVASLLEFLEGILPGVTCCGKSEGTKLASALQATTLWLLQVLQSCADHLQIYEKTTEILKCLVSNDFYVAMMCLAKYIEPETYEIIENKCHEIECSTDDLSATLRMFLTLDPDILNTSQMNDEAPSSVIRSWLAVQVAIDPGCATESLVQRLRLLQRLKNFSNSLVYAEVMRGSLVYLHDTRNSRYATEWGAFCFLKVPCLLAAMANNDSSTICNAVDLLAEPTVLLETMDAQFASSNLDSLLGEMVKNNLIADSQKAQLMSRFDITTELKLEIDPSAGAGIPRVIICAEPTVAGILKTLSSDFPKVQDSLLGMLHQVLSGKSFELVLAVATVQGQLNSLVHRLVRINECSKIGGDKARCQLFDISFIMLVAIVQKHGAASLLEGQDCLIEKWVTNCMIEPNRPKSSEQLLKLCDPSMVDALLRQFNSGEADFSAAPNVKWQDILFNMAGVMKEVLIAWEQGSLAPADVKRILIAISGKMCCIPLAAAAWLCAYMRTAPQDILPKPFNMVHELLLLAPTDADEFLMERWQLSCEIIRKMQRDVQPMKPRSGRQFVSANPAAEQVNFAWKACISRGLLDYSSARTLHCLLETAGARWIVTSVLQELLKIRHIETLKKGADLAFAIFHVDIKSCSLQLLSIGLPHILLNSLQADSLVEPQLSTLAKLTSHCIYAASSFPGTENEEDEEDEEEEEASLEVPPKRQKVEVMRDKILDAIHQLLTTLETGIQYGQLPQQTYFTFQLLKSLVEVKTSRSQSVLSAIPPSLGSQLLRNLPESFTPGILLNLHNLNTTQGRSFASRDLCILRNYQLRYAVN